MKTKLTNSAPGLVAVRVAADCIRGRQCRHQSTRAFWPKPHGTLCARLLRVQPRRGLHDERFLDVPC